MFLGVINENYNSTEYLEMELENSLLFFNSLDIIQESGIQILQEGAWETIKTKIKELWGKFIGFLGKIKDWIKSIFSKDKNSSANTKSGNEVAYLNKDVIKLDKLPDFGSMQLGTEALIANIEKDIEESDLPAATEYTTKYKDIADKLNNMGDIDKGLIYKSFDNEDERKKQAEESLKDIKAAKDTLSKYSNEISKLEEKAKKIYNDIDKYAKEIVELDNKQNNTTSHEKAFRSMNSADVNGLKEIVSAVTKIVKLVDTAEKICNTGGSTITTDKDGNVKVKADGTLTKDRVKNILKNV